VEPGAKDQKMEVLISGFFGFKNTGDEAILEAMLSGLKENDPKTSIKVMSAHPAETGKRYQVKAVSRLDLKALKDCDVFISGGGGLLQDATSFHSFYYYLGLILLAKLFRKKVFVFAQGMGPINFPLNAFLLKLVLRYVDLITLRDQTSFNYIKSLKIKNPRVVETADPTFLLTPQDGEKILELEGLKPAGKPLVGISVRDNIGKKITVMAEFADWLTREQGCEVVFVPFEYPKDTRISNQIMRLMDEDSTLVFRVLRPREVLGVISKMQFFIGMRLHSLIFSAINLVPAAGIAYDPKVSAFMEEVELPFMTLEQMDLKGLKNTFLNIRNNEKKLKKRLELHKRKMLSKAWLNFGMVEMLKCRP